MQVNLQCFPLYSALAALANPTVNLLRYSHQPLPNTVPGPSKAKLAKALFVQFFIHTVFSFSLAGAELPVLQSLPWAEVGHKVHCSEVSLNLCQVDIEVVVLELEPVGRERREEAHHYLQQKEYQYVGTLGG